MAYLNSKFLRNKKGTKFLLANGNTADIPLSVVLSRDDFNVIVAIVEGAYTAGCNAGSRQLAAEMRELLGIDSCKENV